MANRLTAEQAKEIKEMRAAGHTLEETALAVGCSLVTVRHVAMGLTAKWRNDGEATDRKALTAKIAAKARAKRGKRKIRLKRAARFVGEVANPETKPKPAGKVSFTEFGKPHSAAKKESGDDDWET